MQNTAPQVMEHPYLFTLKVHRPLCLELNNRIEIIRRVIPAIELARPRCKTGLKALGLLHRSLEISKLLLQDCSESSKLYLAISGKRIVLRCERIHNSLESCLSQLQRMVESPLAAQISQIVDDLKSATFTLDSSEDEAGQVLLALMRQNIAVSRSVNVEESKAFEFAALRLQITSPKSISIEKESIKKLLRKTHDPAKKKTLNKTHDLAKKKILNYFLYLVRKYEKSFEGGNDNDELSSCSVSSFSSSLGSIHLQVTNVSFRSSDTNNLDFATEFETEDGPVISEKICRLESCEKGVNLFILGKLSALGWTSRRKAVEDLKNELKANKRSNTTISTTYIKPLLKFLKDAHQYRDSEAQRHGAELLLMFLEILGSEVPPLPQDAIHVMTLFLDSEITEEAFAIMEVLVCQKHYSPEIVASGILPLILGILKNPKNKHHKPAMKVLCNLSAHIEIGHHMIYLDYIQTLVPFLDDLLLCGYCVRIFKNLCDIEEGRVHLEQKDCIFSIGELLELGNDEEQENATDILLNLCRQNEELCGILIMQDAIVSSLVNISQNGNSRGKLISVELLRLLNLSQECRVVDDIFVPEIASDDSRPKKSCWKKSGFFCRKIS